MRSFFLFWGVFFVLSNMASLAYGQQKALPYFMKESTFVSYDTALNEYNVYANFGVKSSVSHGEVRIWLESAGRKSSVITGDVTRANYHYSCLGLLSQRGLVSKPASSDCAFSFNTMEAGKYSIHFEYKGKKIGEYDFELLEVPTVGGQKNFVIPPQSREAKLIYEHGELVYWVPHYISQYLKDSIYIAYFIDGSYKNSMHYEIHPLPFVEKWQPMLEFEPVSFLPYLTRSQEIIYGRYHVLLFGSDKQFLHGFEYDYAPNPKGVGGHYIKKVNYPAHTQKLAGYLDQASVPKKIIEQAQAAIKLELKEMAFSNNVGELRESEVALCVLASDAQAFAHLEKADEQMKNRQPGKMLESIKYINDGAKKYKPGCLKNVMAPQLSFFAEAISNP